MSLALSALIRHLLYPIGNERGQDLVEYVVIAALVASVVLLILVQVTPDIAPFLQQLFEHGEGASRL